MKIGILGYDTINIGDDIQSYVTATLLGEIGKKIDYIILRDNYDKIYDYNTGMLTNITEPILLIMNGWFMHSPDGKYNITQIKFPIKNKLIKPLYVSICMPEQIKELYKEECIENYKENEPIYTRDMTSCNLLKSKNIEAKYYGCITQLLKREEIIDNNIIYMVDCPEEFINEIKKDNKIEIINHYNENLRKMNPKERILEAEKILNKYKQCKKIYTTRLHCYLPCRAMGCDVTYIGTLDYRTQDLINNNPDINLMKKIFYKELENKLSFN